VEEGFSKGTVLKFSNVLMKNTCNVGIKKSSGKVHFFAGDVRMKLRITLDTFRTTCALLSMQYLLQLQLANPCLLPDVVIEADRRYSEFEGTSCTSMKLFAAVVNLF
jgi:hypothetical protein